jgi:hypothetical protein
MSSSSSKEYKCNGSTKCDSFNNPTRNEAILYMYDKLNKSLVKVATTTTECQIKYNSVLSKLYFNAIANVDAETLCSLNPNTKNKILSNIDIYSDKLLSNNFYPSLDLTPINYTIKYNEDNKTSKFDWVIDKPSNLCGNSVDGVLNIPQYLCYDNCYKLTLKITGIYSLLCPLAITIKDTNNPSYNVKISGSNNADANGRTYDCLVPIRINQKIYISNFDLQGGAMSATLTNTECFQYITSIYDIINDGAYLPAVFTSKGSSAFFLDYKYIELPRLTTDYIYWNTDTNKLPCIDPLQGRKYNLYYQIELRFEIALSLLSKFELDIYFGSRESSNLIKSIRGIPLGFAGNNNLVVSDNEILNCGRNNSNLYIDFTGDKPFQTVKLMTLYFKFTSA